MIIPFFITHAGCPHRCVFCDQGNITGQARPEDPSGVAPKVRAFLAGKHTDRPVRIAFYGGTFTALPRDLQERYFEAARPFIASGEVESIRISTRPDAVDDDILPFLKDRGVAMIELGAQSMDDRVLHLAGRGHTARDTRQAAARIRERGLGLGIQLMPGLPGDSEENFRSTVEQVVALRPDCVRIYPALVIKGTPLERLYRKGAYTPLALEEAVSWCGAALLRFREAGIDVIRVGLQPTDGLAADGTIVAGPHHPAFRQIVESSLYLEQMRTALRAMPDGSGPATFFVNPSDLSTAFGQKRNNIKTLRREFGMPDIRCVSDPAVRRGGIRFRGADGRDLRNVV